MAVIAVDVLEWRVSEVRAWSGSRGAEQGDLDVQRGFNPPLLHRRHVGANETLNAVQLTNCCPGVPLRLLRLGRTGPLAFKGGEHGVDTSQHSTGERILVGCGRGQSQREPFRLRF